MKKITMLLSCMVLFAFTANATVNPKSSAEPPTVPQNLVVSNVTETNVDLSWDPSTDNVGVTAYDVYNGDIVAKTATSPSASITGLTPNTTYHFRVKAKDAAGNVSGFSDTLSVTTVNDTIPPTIPPKYNRTITGLTSATITWDASSDNVAVAGYEIYIGNMLWRTFNSTSRSTYATGVDFCESFPYKIRAFDASGNRSQFNSLVSILVYPPEGCIICTYCASKGANQEYEWITGVSVGDFSSSSGKDSGGYGNYTGKTISMTQGNSYNITLTPNNTSYTEHFKVWIDFNKDCDFEDSGEEVFSGSAMGNTTGTISVPSTANGMTRMRVAMKYNAAPDSSCGDIPYGEVEDYTVIFKKESSAPSTPTNLIASNITSTSVDLSWDASTDDVGISGYELFNGSTQFITVSTTSYTVNNLLPDTTYSFAVRARDAAGNLSDISTPVSVTTLNEIDTIPPSPPTNLIFKDGNLSWTASTDNVGVVGYDIFQGSTDIGDATGTSFNLTGLTPNSTYTFSVRAKDAAGNVSDPATINVTIPPDPIEYCESKGTSQQYEWIAGVQIGNFSNTSGAESNGYGDYTSQMIYLNVNSGNSVTLTPNTDSYNEHFKIWIDYNGDYDFEDEGEEVFSAKGRGDITGTINVTPGSISSTRMRISMSYNSDPAGPCATIASGEVEDYTVSFAIDEPTAPTAPTGLTSSNITQTSVELNWNPSVDNVGVASYSVYQDNVEVKSSVDTSETITNLNPNTSYSFTVKAKDAAGNVSPASESVSVTTLELIDTIPPSVPTNLNVFNITETSMTLSWTASTDNGTIKSYELKNITSNISYGPSSTTYTITGLTASTTYSFTVLAQDEAGNLSEVSDVVSATTLGTCCGIYCESKGTSQQYEWITEVKVGNFINASVAETDGYGDYTDKIISLTGGSNHSVSFTPSTTQYTEYFKVWIDFNKDYDFEDEGEEVFTGSAKGVVSGTIIIPSTVSGLTRMRVSLKYNIAPTGPCETIASGEVEDYTVNIAAAKSEPVKSAAELAISANPNPSDGNATLKITSDIIGTGNLSIINVNGQVVFSDEVNISSNIIEVPLQLNVPLGTYLLILEMNETIVSKQIVIQ